MKLTTIALALAFLAAPAYAAEPAKPSPPTVTDLTKEVADLKAQLATANQATASAQVLARAVAQQREDAANQGATCAAALYAAQQPAK